MEIIVLDYSNSSLNKVYDIPDNYSNSQIENILEQTFHMSNCSWMVLEDPNTYHYRYEKNKKLIYEDCT